MEICTLLMFWVFSIKLEVDGLSIETRLFYLVMSEKRLTHSKIYKQNSMAPFDLFCVLFLDCFIS